MKGSLRIILPAVTVLTLTCLAAAAQDRPARGPRWYWTSLFEMARDSVYYKHTTQGRVTKMKEASASARLSLTDKTMVERDLEKLANMSAHRDTIVVKDDRTGKEMILMRAIRDDNGEMVANEVLNAAVVTARFRNVAERNGKVDLEFDITVPKALFDSRWQLRFYPTLTMLEKSTRLDAIYVTGREYRREQLRGYERYNRFLASIINDPKAFIDLRNLEIFLKRNIPELYAFKTDTSYVSETEFATVFGVTERDAVAHYTDLLAIRRNNRRIASKQRMWQKYVKTPIVEDGIRLDTVIQNLAGDYVYSYTQTIRTSRNLRKADITLNGEIYEEARRIYTMPESEPLTFYISSLSSFVDASPRYLLQVIERRASASMEYNVDFEVGKANVVPDLRDNASEIGRIKENLAQLMNNEVYDLDSIIVTAFASPEGSMRANDDLCRRRAESVSDYFNRYVRHYQDSLRADAWFSIDMSGSSDAMTSAYRGAKISFISHIGGENWKQLTQEVELCETLGPEEKEEYASLLDIPNLDERESRMKRMEKYRYIREILYPACRTVRFNFYLARKGMVKDTVHSTVLDTAYMRGVELMKDREYEKAVVILRPYQDYNAAVAFCAMDYNASAMAILKDLEPTPQVEYLKAIIHARNGDDKEAVQCFMNAANADHTYFNRGNLDPEIRAIIRRYRLDELDQPDDFDYGY